MDRIINRQIISKLSSDEKDELILELYEENQALKKENAELKTEVAALRKEVAELKATINSMKRLFSCNSETLEKLLRQVSKTGSVQKQNKGKRKKKKRSSKTSSDDSEKGKGHGKTGANEYPDAEHIFHHHSDLKCGDRCPDCDRGNLSDNISDGTILKFIGMPVIIPQVHHPEKLRCTGCGKIFTAKLPDEITTERFDVSAKTVVAMMRYGAGMPFYRLENLMKLQGIKLSDSTMWDMAEQVGDAVYPVFDELVRLAAQSRLLYSDDTKCRILEEIKRKENRKGIFTTAIIADNGKRKIKLFFSGSNHTGENMIELLKERAYGLDKPIFMADALGSNFPDEVKNNTIPVNCNIHARRNFVDCLVSFPDECQYMVKMYARIYRNEKVCKDRNYTPKKRLEYHQKHSGPIMEKMREYARSKIENNRIEENSSLGKAFKYFYKKHWNELTKFLHIPGCPLDNNIVERFIKKSILHRKNSLFYKTENGACIGDMLMSLIFTADESGANPFHYLTILQKNKSLVFKHPDQWLPWNYLETLNKSSPSEKAA